jgi:hypothetical protein
MRQHLRQIDIRYRFRVAPAAGLELVELVSATCARRRVSGFELTRVIQTVRTSGVFDSRGMMKAPSLIES